MSISQLSIIQTMRVFIVLCLLVPLGNFKDESPKSIYDLLPGGKNSPLSVQNGEASQLTVPMLQLEHLLLERRRLSEEELPSDQPAIFSKLVRELSVSPSILENRGELTDLLKSSVKSIMKEDPVLPTINPDVHSSEELQNAKENLPPEVAKDPSVGAMVSLMMTTGKKAAKKVASKKKVKKATQYAIHDAIDAHIKKALAHKVKEEQTKIPKQTNDINKVKESMKRVCQEAKSAGKEAKKDPKILKSGEDEIRKMAGDAIDRASSDSVDVMLTDAGFVKMTLFDLLKPVEDAKTDKEPANVSKILRELGWRRGWDTAPRLEDKEEIKEEKEDTKEEKEDKNKKSFVAHLTVGTHVAMLPTALVQVYAVDGEKHLMRAMLDPCSEESFLTEAAARKLRVRRTPISGHITGVEKMKATLQYEAEIEFSSRIEPKMKMKATAYIVRHLTDMMPENEVKIEDWRHIEKLCLADPTCHTPGHIDLLLGVEVWSEIIKPGVIKGPSGTPIAQDTHLGWIVSGKARTDHTATKNIVSMYLNVDLNIMLRKSWELETIEDERERHTLTSDKEKAENIYETHKRREDVSHVVTLPFREVSPVLPCDSREVVEVKGWMDGDRRLDTTSKLKKDYNEVLQEYSDLKHMEKVDNEEIPENCVYLPQHTVDDVWLDHDTEDEAKTNQRQITAILKRGEFELQNWSSNRETLLRDIDPVKRSPNAQPEENGRDSIKTLGIIWNTKEDKLQITNKMKDLPEQPVTKTNVVAEIVLLFDAIGWLDPVVIAKTFMQKLWTLGEGWDKELAEDVKKDWLKFRNEIPALTEVKLNRWIHTHADRGTVEVHESSDASMSAYAAVIYVRATDKDGKIQISLLTAKTKAAPLKQVSMPRLEMCAAVLLCRLLKHVVNILKVQNHEVFARSDNRGIVVLSWIKGEPGRWTPFVKKRVTEIKKINEINWYNVNTKHNPADPASRGVMPRKLMTNTLWWNGPAFLKEPAIELPETEVPEIDLESRKVIKTLVTTSKETDMYLVLTLMCKYSSLGKLVRVIAYCRRWMLHLKRKRENKEHLPTYLTTEHKDEALTICLRRSHEIEFQEEIEDLKSKRQLKRKSSLLSLTPFLDPKGVLRVGGRLRHADIGDQQKHIILIMKDNALLPLLLAEAYSSTLHGGPQLMEANEQTNNLMVENTGNTNDEFLV